MRKYITGLLALTLLAPQVLFAYTAIDGQERIRIDQPIEDNAYVVAGKSEVEANLAGDGYLFGGDILVNGKIGDNAVISGGRIETRNDIGGDALIAGGDIRIRGVILGDARIAGGDITLEKPVSGDLMVAGGDIRIDKEVEVGKDVGIAGGNVTFNGKTKGKAHIYAGVLSIDGVIEKDATIMVEDVKKIQIGPNAKILGNLTYYAPEKIPQLENIATGTKTYKPSSDFAYNMDGHRDYADEAHGAYDLYQLLFLLVFGSLLLVFARKYFNGLAKNVIASPVTSLFYGFLYFVLTPFAILLTCLTVVGIPVGMLMLATYIFSFVFAKLLALVVFTEVIAQRFREKMTAPWHGWAAFGMLAVVLALAEFLTPIVSLFAFGAVVVSVSQLGAKK